MQININQAWIDTYESNLRFAVQQNESMLSDKVMFGTVEGEKKRFTFIGKAAMEERVEMLGKTVIQDMEFWNRWIGRRIFDFGFMIDRFDDVERSLTDPTSAIVQAGVKAAKRQKDLVILQALGGIAYTGKEATTPVAFPSKQIIDVQLGGGGSNAPMNMAKLRELKARRDESEIADDVWYIAVSPRQIQSLLADPTVTSSDYNSLRALESGTIKGYMGFEFVNINMLPIANSVRSCWCWAKSAMQLGISKEIFVNGPTPDSNRHFNLVGEVTLALDAVRLFDDGVFQVPCAETLPA